MKKNERQVTFTNEHLNDTIAFYDIRREQIKTSINGDIRGYYEYTRGFLRHLNHLMTDKIVETLIEELNKVEEIITIPKPNVTQRLKQYHERRRQAFRKIEQIALKIDRELAKKGFFKKMFTQDFSGISADVRH